MLQSRLLGPLAIALTALGGVTAPCARELDATRVLERVQAWLDETRDLEARFEQALISGALGAGVEESGRLLLQRPGKMRWDYLEPEVKVALVEGDRTRLYLEEEGQLWEGRLEAAEGLLPALLAGQDPLERLFEASLQATPNAGGEGAYHLRLTPREAEESFEGILLVLRPPRFALEEVEVLDLAGNRMLYRFSGLERNRGLAAAAFYFEPPPGTEIVAEETENQDP